MLALNFKKDFFLFLQVGKKFYTNLFAIVSLNFGIQNIF